MTLDERVRLVDLAEKYKTISDDCKERANSRVSDIEWVRLNVTSIVYLLVASEILDVLRPVKEEAKS